MRDQRLTILALTLAVPFAAAGVQAETFTGRINGHHCAHGGETCPVDRLDPHLALERDFVLQAEDGTYYFMTNLPRDMKVRHVLSLARVTGELEPRYRTLIVEELAIKDGDGYTTVWSQQKQTGEWAYFLGTGGLGPVVGSPPGR